MSKCIYLDHAATTKVCTKAVEAMQPYWQEYYGNPSSVYELGLKANEVMENGRSVLAEMLHCRPEQIFFTSGGTESDNWALIGTAFANFHRGKHIITSAIEHPAVKSSCEYLKTFGFEISYIGVDQYGMIRLDELERAIRKDTILISVMTANNEIGTIQPIHEIGKLAQKHDVLFHTDAVQAFGHIPIHVTLDHIDLLSVSSHKFGGPKGVGFLYVKDKNKIISFMNGGHQELGLRAGTGNVAGVAGMTAAAVFVRDSMNVNMSYERKLRDYMQERLLREIPYSFVNGHRYQRLPGNLNIGFFHVEGEALLTMLDMKGICISTGSACAAKSESASYVLRAIGLSEDAAHNSVRISLSYENTWEEINTVILAIKECVYQLRKV